VWILGATIWTGLAPFLSAVSKENPYQVIWIRDPFRLRYAVEEMQSAKVTPPKLVPKVQVTGLTNLGGKKRALLEITSPGKPERKPILAEGETVDEVTVLVIDVDRSRIEVKIGGVETSLTLQTGGSFTGQNTSVLHPLTPPGVKLESR
jgi:hypothetical protein